MLKPTEIHIFRSKVLIFLAFLCGMLAPKSQETRTFYSYGSVYDAMSKSHYYSNIFVVKVDFDDANTEAELATSRLASAFHSYIFQKSKSAYLTKMANYFSTKSEAEDDLSYHTKMNHAGGEITFLMNYFRFKFNKDE